MKVVLMHLLLVNIALYCRVLKTWVIILGHLLLVKLPCASGSADFSDSVWKLSPHNSTQLKPYSSSCNGKQVHNIFCLSTSPVGIRLNKHWHVYASSAHGLLKKVQHVIKCHLYWSILIFSPVSLYRLYKQPDNDRVREGEREKSLKKKKKT